MTPVLQFPGVIHNPPAALVHEFEHPISRVNRMSASAAMPLALLGQTKCDGLPIVATPPNGTPPPMA